MAEQIDPEVLAHIKGKYLASVFQPDPPSLVDMCDEFDLDTNTIGAIKTISVREQWEEARRENYATTKRQLADQATAHIDAVMVNFKKALKGMLASKLTMLEQFKTQVDGQLMARLIQGTLNANQLMRLREMNLSDENNMLKIVLTMAKIMGLEDDPDPEGEEGNKDSEGKPTGKGEVIQQWRVGAKAIEATGTTPPKSAGTDRERKPLFEKLDQTREDQDDER